MNSTQMFLFTLEPSGDMRQLESVKLELSSESRWSESHSCKVHSTSIEFHGSPKVLLAGSSCVAAMANGIAIELDSSSGFRVADDVS